MVMLIVTVVCLLAIAGTYFWTAHQMNKQHAETMKKYQKAVDRIYGIK
jgi:hypothetical protein